MVEFRVIEFIDSCISGKDDPLLTFYRKKKKLRFALTLYSIDTGFNTSTTDWF